MGELGAAIARADESVDIASTIAAPRVELTARLWRLWPLSELGDHDRFAEDVERAREIGNRVGGHFLRPPWRRPGDGCRRGRGARPREKPRSPTRSERRATPRGELLLALRLEVACWEERGDGPRLARAAEMLGEAAEDRTPPLAAWAAYAAALADPPIGDAARRVRSGRGARARDRGLETPLVWRCHALPGRSAPRSGEWRRRRTRGGPGDPRDDRRRPRGPARARALRRTERRLRGAQSAGAAQA